ncbi:putative E3 ubiquitin-protein ligase HERC1 [Nymphon striatum]|nr:putative E3 ubiquitin-protein ligase HERC1 [Nymphon striatum]
MSSSLKLYHETYLDPNKLKGITSTALRDIALLSGISEELLSPALPKVSAASSSGASEKSSETINNSKPAAASVESLTDTMISNILHEVTQNVDNEISPVSSDHTFSPIIDPSPPNYKHENVFMKLKFLQLSALKAFIVIAGCDRFTELLLIPKSPANDVSNEEIINAELKDSMRQLMKQMVKQSVNPLPFKKPVNIAELERAACVLYHSHISVHMKAIAVHQGKNSTSERSLSELTSPSTSRRITPSVKSAPTSTASERRPSFVSYPSAVSSSLETGVNEQNVPKPTSSVIHVDVPFVDLIDQRLCVRMIDSGHRAHDIINSTFSRPGLCPSDINKVATSSVNQRKNKRSPDEVNELLEENEYEELFDYDISSCIPFITMPLEKEKRCKICKENIETYCFHMFNEHPGCYKNTVFVHGRGDCLCGDCWSNETYVLCQDCIELHSTEFNNMKPEDDVEALSLCDKFGLLPPRILPVGAKPSIKGIDDLSPEDITARRDYLSCLLPDYGFNDRIKIPSPLPFTEDDPLGSFTIINSQECNQKESNQTGTTSSSNSHTRIRSLGIQASKISSMEDRLTAVLRVSSAAQILLARTIVMKALSLLSLSLSAGLKSMGLSDIDLIVKLMCLTAAGRVEFDVKDPYLIFEVSFSSIAFHCFCTFFFIICILNYFVFPYY